MTFVWSYRLDHKANTFSDTILNPSSSYEGDIGVLDEEAKGSSCSEKGSVCLAKLLFVWKFWLVVLVTVSVSVSTWGMSLLGFLVEVGADALVGAVIFSEGVREGGYFG